MSRKIGIIGGGHVGSTVAMSLALRDFCNDITIVDQSFSKAEAQALDLIDAMPYAPSYTRIMANDDVSVLADADILVNCIRPTERHENPMDFLAETATLVHDIFSTIMDNGFRGIIINITEPCEAITMLIQQVTGLPKNRVFGTGTALDTSRLYAHLGLTLQLDPTRISGFILGDHANSNFIAWSTIRIDSFLMEKVIEDLPPGLGMSFEVVEESLQNAATKIRNGKSYLNFAISQVVTRIIYSIYNNTQTILPLAVYSKEYDTYLSVPTTLWQHGIRYNMPIILTDEEQVRLSTAATSVKSTFAAIKQQEDSPSIRIAPK